MSDVYVLEATPYDMAAGAARALRLSAGGLSRSFYKTGGGWQLWPGALTRLPRLSRKIAYDGALIGTRSLPELGEVEISLNDPAGRRDWYRLQWVGRSVTVLRGSGPNIDGYAPVLLAEVSAVSWTDSALTLQLKPAAPWLDQGIAQPLYPGTGLLGGHPSLKNQPLIQIYGLVQNVQPDLLDDAVQLYRCNSRQMAQLLWVRDRGQLLTFQADYASGVNLLAAAQAGAIAKGSYATCLAEGLMTLGAKPSGRVTFAARGDNQDGYAESAADIARLILFRLAVPPTAVDASSFDNARLAFPAPSGLVIRNPVILRDLLDQLATTAECITRVDRLGRIGWTRLSLKTATQVVRGPRRESVQGLQLLPPPRLFRLSYAMNWTQMSQDELFSLLANDPGVVAGSVPPVDPYPGQLWQDTAGVIVTLKRWTGVQWEEVSRLITGTSQLIDDADLGLTANWSGVTGTGKPEDGATRTLPRGDYAAGTLYARGDIVRHNGASWIYVNLVSSQNIAPPDAGYWKLLAADGAAGTSSEIFFTESAPAFPVVGWIWFRPSTKELRMWDGTSWVLTGGGGQVAALDQIDTAWLALNAVTRAIIVKKAEILSVFTSSFYPGYLDWTSGVTYALADGSAFFYNGSNVTANGPNGAYPGYAGRADARVFPAVGNNGITLAYFPLFPPDYVPEFLTATSLAELGRVQLANANGGLVFVTAKCVAGRAQINNDLATGLALAVQKSVNGGASWTFLSRATRIGEQLASSSQSNPETYLVKYGGSASLIFTDVVTAGATIVYRLVLGQVNPLQSDQPYAANNIEISVQEFKR